MRKQDDDEVIAMALLAIVGTMALVTLLAGVSGLVTMFAWNVVVAGMFHGPHINFIQALGVGLIISILQSIFSRKK